MTEMNEYPRKGVKDMKIVQENFPMNQIDFNSNLIHKVPWQSLNGNYPSNELVRTGSTRCAAAKAHTWRLTLAVGKRPPARRAGPRRRRAPFEEVFLPARRSFRAVLLSLLLLWRLA